MVVTWGRCDRMDLGLRVEPNASFWWRLNAHRTMFGRCSTFQVGVPCPMLEHVGTCWNIHIDSLDPHQLEPAGALTAARFRKFIGQGQKLSARVKLDLKQQNLTLEICCEDAVWPALAEQVVLLTREARSLEE